MRTKKTSWAVGAAVMGATLGLSAQAWATTASAPFTYLPASSSMEYDLTQGPNSATTTNVYSGTIKSSTTTPPSFNPPGVVSLVPTTSIPATPSYQFNDTTTLNKTTNSNNFTKGTASVQAITNATTIGVTIQAGTGVAQSNPNGLYTGADHSSKMAIILNDIKWQVGSNSFGTGTNLLKLTATVPFGYTVGSGAGAYVEFDANLSVIDVTQDSFLGSITLGPMEFSHTAGTTIANSNFEGNISNLDVGPVGTSVTSSFNFSQSIFLLDDGEAPAVIPAGDILELTGSINFRSQNDGSPSGGTTTDLTGVGLFDSGDGTGDPNFTPTIEPAGGVPEPTTVILSILAIGAAGLTAARRR